MSPAAQEVLAFWFAETNMPRWFAADAAFDVQIRERFGRLLDAAARGALDEWKTTPLGWLAWLVVLDQFSRNIHRHDPQAWAHDASAQEAALSGIARGDDRQLPPLQRVFAYLPLEHAEDMALQQRSVALFEVLCAEAPPEHRERFEGFLDYARRHREVIARFGRFPHRNALLGRASTSEEMFYLAGPNAEF